MNSRSTSCPSVSVVVITHNEGERLARTVHGLLATIPRDGELLVVDDRSTDASCDSLPERFPDVRMTWRDPALNVEWLPSRSRQTHPVPFLAGMFLAMRRDATLARDAPGSSKDAGETTNGCVTRSTSTCLAPTRRRSSRDHCDLLRIRRHL